MNTAAHFNVLAFIVSGIVYYLIGWLWYSPLFGKAWAEQTGTKMDGSTMAGLPMLGQLVATFLLTLGVYMVVMLGGFGDIKGALIAGLSITAFFIIPINAGKLLFLNKSKLFLIDVGYYGIGAIVSAIILAFWK